MSEPIVLHDGAGNTLTVYTRSQAEALYTHLTLPTKCSA